MKTKVLRETSVELITCGCFECEKKKVKPHFAVFVSRLWF